MIKPKTIYKILTIFVIIVFIFLLNKTYATQTQENFNITIKDIIKEDNGKREVVIHTYINEIKIEKGIIVYQAKINYDENIFEKIEIEETDIWNKPILKNNKLIGYTKNGKATNKAGELFTLKLTVKENVKDIETNINIEEIEVANTKEKSKASKPYTVAIKIKAAEKTNKTNLLLPIIIAIIITLIIITIYIIKNKNKRKETKK